MPCSTSNPGHFWAPRKQTPKALSAALFAHLLVAATTARAEAPEITWELGASNQFFHYEETLPNGATFNTEKGWLPGLYLSSSVALPRDFLLAFTVSRAKGTVDYEGATQAGRALSTNTIETLTRVRAELVTPLPNVLPDALTGVIDIGYTRWNRKIQPTRYSSHLYEHYRWYEFSGGLRHCSTPSALPGIERICATAKLTRTEYGTMIVRLEQLNLGNPELNLGGNWGGEASLKLDLEGPFTLRLYSKTWNHGASNPVIIQQAKKTTRITEPASQSWLTGLEVGLRF
ncbi:MAG: hypothetical protein L0J77_09450 [Marinobacter sp.]|nr:hypothetical protein [Marinobacter sp.]